MQYKLKFLIKKNIALIFFAITVLLIQIEAQELMYKKLLSLSLEELLQIQITTAGKKSEKVKDIPASVTIMTRNEIELFGFKNLDELLAQITGLYIFESFHPMGKVSVGIRGYTTPGGGNDNIIILVNGVNQVEGVYDQYLLPKVGLSVDMIDRIEIIKGPMSVLYGSGAFFGAINIITNSPNFLDKNFIDAGIGSNNSGKIVFKTHYAKDDFGLIFNASSIFTDGIDDQFNKMMSNSKGLIAYGLNENSSSKKLLIDNRNYINLSGYFENFTFDLSHTTFRKGGFLIQPAVDESSIKMQSSNAMLTYQNSLSENTNYALKASLLSSSSDANYQLTEKNSYINFGYNSSAFEVEANLFHNFSQYYSVTFGIIHRNVFEISNPFEGDAAWGASFANTLNKLTNNSTLKTNSLFSQFDLAPLDNLKIVAGIRLEQVMEFEFEASSGASTVSNGRLLMKDSYKENDVHFIPRLAFIYNPFENHYFKLLYGEALRHPPMGQLADNIYNTKEFGFPKIKPAKIRTFEINYIAELEKSVFINISLFHNELSNLITQKTFTQPNGETGSYSSNIGEISTNGIETLFKIIPLDRLEISLGCTYQNSKNKTSGYTEMTVPYSPEFLGYASLLCLINENINLAVFGNYVGKMESDYSIDKIRYGQAVEAYFKLNANLRIKNFIFNNFYSNIRISNLLNRAIHNPVTSISSFADKGILLPGREFFITFGYEF